MSAPLGTIPPPDPRKALHRQRDSARRASNAALALLLGGGQAMLAAALTNTGLGKVMGVLAVALAAVNIFGGFLVTRRMLEMFRKKPRPAAGSPGQEAR